jgi:hypothetical protein
VGTASLDSEEHEMTGPIRRVHYFVGQLLTAEDLQAEQDYHRRMRYLHNRLLGQGVVEGLDVTVEDEATIVVSAGLAIDRLGREIVLAEDIRLRVPAMGGPDDVIQVTVSWAEQPDAFVPSVDPCDGEAPFTRWLEQPQLTFTPGDGTAPEALVLGRVLVSAGAITAVDLSGRDAWRKRKHRRTVPIE